MHPAPHGDSVSSISVVFVGERPWFGPAPAWPHLRTGAGISILDGKAHTPIRMDTVTREAGGECMRIMGILRERRACLEETYHVGSIGIFGSCDEGVEHGGSDVDILVEFSEVPGIFGFLGAWAVSLRTSRQKNGSGRKECAQTPHRPPCLTRGHLHMTAPRSTLDYLDDILDAVDKIAIFTRGMSYEEFFEDDKTAYAVTRALEVIGEATKCIPQRVREVSIKDALARAGIQV